jgi:hypothetical protein
MQNGNAAGRAQARILSRIGKGGLIFRDSHFLVAQIITMANSPGKLTRARLDTITLAACEGGPAPV